MGVDDVTGCAGRNKVCAAAGRQPTSTKTAGNARANRRPLSLALGDASFIAQSLRAQTGPVYGPEVLI